MAEGKKHVSIVICGHVDAGKSTTTGRLIFELGGIPEREMQKLRDEADKLGKGSFAFAFYMDRQKDERERGVTISCTTKEFFTESYHYTVIDAPGHRDFIKNMITGASQADIALIMIPADGNFATSIAKGNHKAGEVQGQTRQHALLINLLGVKQIIIGVNKMDCDLAGYKEARYNEVKDEMVNVLTRVGWKKEFVDKSVPFLPISGWKGDNLIKQSENMKWWKGVEVEVPGKGKKHIVTLLDALEHLVVPPERQQNKVMRTPISGVYKIKGAGDVLTGRVEQGTVKPGDEVVFLPTHTPSLPCTGKIFSVEMHHKSQPAANAGDNVGLNVKGLVKENMPRVGDIMILKSDQTIKKCKEFTCQVQILNHPGELKVGYSPIAFVRTARSAVRMSKINWKLSKETGNKKAPDPVSIKATEMAEVVFAPQQPFVVDSFKNCEGLGRIAIMEGATVVMLGKVNEVIFDDGIKQPEVAKGAAPAKGAPAAKGAAPAPAAKGAAPAPAAAKAAAPAPAAKATPAPAAKATPAPAAKATPAPAAKAAPAAKGGAKK
jgi:elongation factor 1-alpha